MIGVECWVLNNMTMDLSILLNAITGLIIDIYASGMLWSNYAVPNFHVYTTNRWLMSYKTFSSLAFCQGK